MWRNPWSGLGDTLHWGDDRTVGLVLGTATFTWQAVGTLLFAVAAIGALIMVARRDDLRGVLLASLVLAIAFFVLPTRVHERYLFPALVLGGPARLLGTRLALDLRPPVPRASSRTSTGSIPRTGRLPAPGS